MARTLNVVLLALTTHAAHAAGLTVSLLDSTSHPVADVVVVLEPAAGADRPAAAARTVAPAAHAVIDQRNLRFVPEISVIRSGTAIEFPNSDNVRHQVYSFSPAKNFRLALYAGHIYPPLVFDKPGLVTLGCNIHDAMIGFVYVTDSPWFGKTNAQGRLELPALPAGDYHAVLWHPRFAEAAPQIERDVTVAARGDATLAVTLQHPMQAEPSNNAAQRWKSY